MPTHAFGLPICSARDLGTAQRHDPAHDRSHDCCAAACALAGIAGGPTTPPHVARIDFGAWIVVIGRVRIDAPAGPLDRPPNARAPYGLLADLNLRGPRLRPAPAPRSFRR